LTFTASLADTDEVDVHHMSIRSTVSHVADGSVTTAKLDDVGVTTAKIANDAVTGAKIENNPTIAGNLSVGGTASITGISTFTGASTFSGGIANTGTISAGTIGTDVVFPAGHILQVLHNTDTTNVWGSDEFMMKCFCNITVKSATSNILIHAGPQIYIGADANFDIRFYYKASTGWSTTIAHYTAISAARHDVVGVNSSADPQDFVWTPFVSELWDHNQSAGTVINVALSGDSSNGQNAYNNQGTGASSSMTLFEIAT